MSENQSVLVFLLGELGALGVRLFLQAVDRATKRALLDKGTYISSVWRLPSQSWGPSTGPRAFVSHAKHAKIAKKNVATAEIATSNAIVNRLISKAA